MEFTRNDFLRMITAMKITVEDNPEIFDEKRGSLLCRLEELERRLYVDRDKIFIIGIKD